MTVKFELPDVGEGLKEAEILEWLVEVGDTVEEDQPIAEIETDKAVVEVPSPVDGIVRNIHAQAGDFVDVGTVIVTFDVDEEAIEAAGTEEAAQPSPEEPAAEKRESAVGDGRVFAAPSVRRRARELGVDVSTLSGSGPGGRVTGSDVAAAAAKAIEEGPGEPGERDATTLRQETGGPAETAAETPTTNEPDVGGGGTAQRDRTLATPATRKLAREHGIDVDEIPTDETHKGVAFVTAEHVESFAESPDEADLAEARDVVTDATAGVEKPDAEVETAEPAGPQPGERIPYRGVRRTIGEQMEQSKFTAPHATHHDEFDVTRLVEVRSRLAQRASDRDVSLTYTPFVLKAVVSALAEYPVLNARLDEDEGEIHLLDEYNIGVATATDHGLVVPVIEAVDDKGLLAVAEETNRLVEKARERTIAPEELQGGTFSVTNFGAIGGRYATPIINYPETAILGLGAIEKRPRVVDETGHSEPLTADGRVPGEIVPRYVLPLSLSIDHRVVDGADAARFVNAVGDTLERPELLLLE